MRICLASLHPRVLSGQIDSLAGLGRSLTQRGHEVALVAPFDTSELLHQQLTDLDNGPTGLIPTARVMLRTVPRIIRATAGHDLLHLALPTPAFSWLGDVIQLATTVPV